jgi:hypothetical protein
MSLSRRSNPTLLLRCIELARRNWRSRFRLLLAIAITWLLLAPVHGITQAADNHDAQRFSSAFLTASIRLLEDSMLWKESIVKVVAYDAPAGPWLDNYRNRAAESLQLASMQAATAADAEALKLFANHFNNLEQWNHSAVSAQHVRAAGTFNAAVLKEDRLFSRISECDKFLGIMLTSGIFADSPACH